MTNQIKMEWELKKLNKKIFFLIFFCLAIDLRINKVNKSIDKILK